MNLERHPFTGDETIDAIISRVIEIYREALPNRPMSWYLVGSYADGTANTLSDIDLVAVARGWTPEDVDREGERRARSGLETSVRVDVGLIAEEELSGSGMGVNVKLASLLLAGEDIRSDITLPSLGVYRDDVVRSATYFIGAVLRGEPAPLSPLRYPDPNDEFFGYARKRVEAWYPPTIDQGLKELVTAATRIATAQLALQADCYVASKVQSIQRHRELIGDQWSDYLSRLYTKGKTDWGYRVPEDAAGRQLLRGLCAEFLALEHRFLEQTSDERANQ